MTTYTVTVVSTGSGNKYFIDGVQQATVTLDAGTQYVFNQDAASNAGHPFNFSQTSDGTHGGGTVYTTNVVYTGDGATVSAADYATNFNSYTTRSVTITPAEALSILYYYCTYHSGMGGTAYIGYPGVAGWGRGAWSSGSWGAFNAVEVTGVQINSTLGTEIVVADSIHEVTGLSMALSEGTVTASEETGVPLVALTPLSSSLGTTTIQLSSSIIPTSLTMSFSEGDTIEEGSVDEGWGRREWGSYNWGGGAPQIVEPDSLLLNATAGTLSAGVGDTVQVTSLQIGTATGTIVLAEGGQTIPVNGIEFNTAISGASVVGEGNAAVVASEDPMQLSLGTVIASSVVNVAVTGVTMTFAEGTPVSEGDNTTAVTALTTVATSLGTVSVAEGTGVIVPLTGLTMTFAEGTETIGGNADVPVTGLTMSLELGNIFSTPWANVNTNANNTWVEVDTATIAA
tara:strand:+ start:17 stop:1384 length:1368 start_codon:yes stop_codon:yes gene_type:complete